MLFSFVCIWPTTIVQRNLLGCCNSGSCSRWWSFDEQQINERLLGTSEIMSKKKKYHGHRIWPQNASDLSWQLFSSNILAFIYFQTKSICGCQSPKLHSKGSCFSIELFSWVFCQLANLKQVFIKMLVAGINPRNLVKLPKYLVNIWPTSGRNIINIQIYCWQELQQMLQSRLLWESNLGLAPGVSVN